MTGDEFADRLVHEGLDPVEGAAKGALHDLAVGALPPDDSATQAWWVPGRLEVFGKHTDYAGGRTLISAVPRGFVFASTPRADDAVVVIDAANREQVRLGTERVPLSGWYRYADVVVARLLRDFPGNGGGLTIAFASDLPRASGMSSSSALVVGIATALIERWGLPARESWQRDIEGRCDLAAYLACVENGSAFRSFAGDSGVGTHGGSEDHIAMLLGVPGQFSAYAFAPARHLRDVPLPSQWSVVVASSGVSAEKTGGAQGAYNELADAAGLLLRLWNESEAPADSLAAALESSDAAADRLEQLVERNSMPGWPVEHLLRRLSHFQQEDACVLAAARAFDSGDAVALGELARQSQSNAEHLLRQQVPETSFLAAAARSCGALAACSFGAGFGGSVWAVVQRADASPFASEWLAQYRRSYDAPRSVAFVAPPGPPVTVIRSR